MGAPCGSLLSGKFRWPTTNRSSIQSKRRIKVGYSCPPLAFLCVNSLGCLPLTFFLMGCLVHTSRVSSEDHADFMGMRPVYLSLNSQPCCFDGKRVVACTQGQRRHVSCECLPRWWWCAHWQRRHMSYECMVPWWWRAHGALRDTCPINACCLGGGVHTGPRRHISHEYLLPGLVTSKHHIVCKMFTIWLP